MKRKFLTWLSGQFTTFLNFDPVAIPEQYRLALFRAYTQFLGGLVKLALDNSLRLTWNSDIESDVAAKGDAWASALATGGEAGRKHHKAVDAGYHFESISEWLETETWLALALETRHFMELPPAERALIESYSSFVVAALGCGLRVKVKGITPDLATFAGTHVLELREILEEATNE